MTDTACKFEKTSRFKIADELVVERDIYRRNDYEAGYVTRHQSPPRYYIADRRVQRNEFIRAAHTKGKLMFVDVEDDA